VVRNLSNNNDIVLLKENKGRGIVILDKNKYTEKCLAIVRPVCQTKQKPKENDQDKNSESG